MHSKLFELEEDILKILANQKRLEIIQLLQKGELNVTEMNEMLGLRQSNLSQHLTLLRQHKLVTVTRRGREAYYKLTDENIGKAVQLIYSFLKAHHNLEVPPNTPLFPIVVDPVCGMRMSASDAFDSTLCNDYVYYFCASGCKDRFISTPNQYCKLSKFATA